MVLWFTCSLVHWLNGSLVDFSMVFCFTVSQVHWFNGSLDCRVKGFYKLEILTQS